MIVEISDKYIFSTKYNGKDDISGHTKFKNGNNEIAIGNCTVKLFDQNSNILLDEVISNNDGLYEFKNISLKKATYFVVSHHPKVTFNGVIADNIGGQNVDD